jgi:hypothetical protein
MCLPPGSPGILVALGILAACWVLIGAATATYPAFTFEKNPGDFDRLLPIFLDIAETAAFLCQSVGHPCGKRYLRHPIYDGSHAELRGIQTQSTIVPSGILREEPSIRFFRPHLLLRRVRVVNRGRPDWIIPSGTVLTKENPTTMTFCAYSYFPVACRDASPFSSPSSTMVDAPSVFRALS